MTNNDSTRRNAFMNLLFENKVALVTGAGAGMGLATAKAFAEAGASVVLADIQEEAVRAEASQLEASGRKALALRCDVSDDGQVAPEAGHGSFDHGRHLTVIAHIAAKSERLPTGGFELRCLGTHRFLLDVRQHH